MLLRYGWASDKTGQAFVEREVSLSEKHARLIIGRNGTGKSLAGKVVQAISHALHASESAFTTAHDSLRDLGLAWFEVEFQTTLLNEGHQDDSEDPFPEEWSDLLIIKGNALSPGVVWKFSELSNLRQGPNSGHHLAPGREVWARHRLKVMLQDDYWLCSASSNLMYAGVDYAYEHTDSLQYEQVGDGEYVLPDDLDEFAIHSSHSKIIDIPAFRYHPVGALKGQNQLMDTNLHALCKVLATQLKEPLQEAYLDVLLADLVQHFRVAEGMLTRQELLERGTDTKTWSRPVEFERGLAVSLGTTIPRFRGLDAFRIKPASLKDWRKNMLKELVEAHRDIYALSGISPRIDSIDDHMIDEGELFRWIDSRAGNQNSLGNFNIDEILVNFGIPKTPFVDENSRIEHMGAVKKFFKNFKFFGFIPLDFERLKEEIDDGIRKDAPELEKAKQRWQKIRPRLQMLKGIFDLTPVGLKRGRDAHQAIMHRLEEYWNNPMLRDIMPWSDVENEALRKRLLVFQTLRHFAFEHDTVTTGLYESFKWLFLHEEDFGSQPLPGLTGSAEPQYVYDQFNGFLHVFGNPKTMPSGYHHILCIIMSILQPPKEIGEEGKEILFIDEPEISLHVDWQERLVALMEQLNQEYRGNGVKLMIATHSPEIIMNHMSQVADFSLNLEV